MVSSSSAAAPEMLDEDRALSLVEEAIAASDADGVFVTVEAGTSALSRFSDNQMTQNLSRTRFSLSITSYVGERSATTTTTELNGDAIRATVQRSRELAEIAPIDPEWVPLLGPQTYPQYESGFDEATATCSARQRGERVHRSCELSQRAGVAGSGSLSTDEKLTAIGNSTGLRASDRRTEAEFSFTARIDDGTGWHQRTAWNLGALPIEALVRDAIARAQASRHPRPIAPATYPVIMTPAAVAELASWIMWNLDARAADEGRS
ncbi:MAG: DNA gyrase modulator, partial [Cyanobacteria bacterium P01_E01_bin.48]